MSLALIAGEGNLPNQIIQSCKQRDIDLIVIGFKGQTNLGTIDIPYAEFGLGSIGEVLRHLKRHSIKEIVFAGGIERPNIKTLGLDWMGAKWLKTLGLRALKGDDDLLSGILELLQKEGFTIIKPSNFLENLMLPPGILTKASPADQDLLDSERGAQILRSLSSQDVGQSALVQNGLVLGIEAIEGTKALIERCAPLKRPGPGGVLVKMAKIGQSKTIDLPTIGPETVQSLKDAGFAGIAAEEALTQVIDLEETIRLADELGLFIVGIRND